MKRILFIILLIVLPAFSCGIEGVKGGDGAHLNECPECVLQSQDAPEQPVNVVEN